MGDIVEFLQPIRLRMSEDQESRRTKQESKLILQLEV